MHRRQQDSKIGTGVFLDPLSVAWRAIELQEQDAPADSKHARKGLIIDIETDGLDRELDPIIEIGLLTFSFDAMTGELLERWGPRVSMLDDPRRPLDPETTRITGLTTTTVEGKRADWELVADTIEAADIIIAHNASFDRPRVEARLLKEFGDVDTDTLWACSYQQLPWIELHGAVACKLPVLCWQLGGFYADGGGHRALDDCKAVLALLVNVPGALRDLYEKATTPSFRIDLRTPYDPSGRSQTACKVNGYRWDGERRVWHKEVDEDDVEDELAWFRLKFTGQKPSGARSYVSKILPNSRFTG